MIMNVESRLMDRGFPEFHVKKELYWPKGKVGASARGRRLTSGPSAHPVGPLGIGSELPPGPMMDSAT